MEKDKIEIEITERSEVISGLINKFYIECDKLKINDFEFLGMVTIMKEELLNTMRGKNN